MFNKHAWIPYGESSSCYLSSVLFCAVGMGGDKVRWMEHRQCGWRRDSSVVKVLYDFHSRNVGSENMLECNAWVYCNL